MSQHSGKILIVDDNHLNRMLLTRALAEQGHTSASAEHGQRALEMLRADSFDVVLLDIVMPEMDGYQVLQTLKADATLRDIPVIVISALDEIESAIRCIEMGAEDYLPKPFNPVLLRARLGASLEKKRLRDQEHLYLQGLERELEIGRRIQFSFLPDEIPQPPGWEIAARFQPARQVSGDLYDVFPMRDQQHIGIVIADVCDKGVGAALFMALFRTLIRATANLDFSNARRAGARFNPGIVLKKVITLTNNYIARTHAQANMFASVFFAILDPATGALAYINAGHEPPIIFNARGVQAQLTRTGMVVGLMPDRPYTVRRARLKPGDTLLAFTDGVTDAMNARGETFDRERLLAMLTPASAANLLDAIETRVRDHIADANQFDDITMLAMRRKPK
ncbi:MAG: SpoIIE family protein phosphatase [Chloroflexi bacterium]|nr:SpoIIE family protein phosphatase [Chloroflexota bacterium]